MEHELFCSRHWIKARLGKLKQEEVGRQRCWFLPFYLHHVFLTPHLKETEGSESAGTKECKTCVCVSAACPTYLFLCAHKVWVPVFLQRKEEEKKNPTKIFWLINRPLDLLAPCYKLLHPLPTFSQISHHSQSRGPV